MSSNVSINLSNVSPAKSSIPLPIPCPATPAPPAMSPRTMQSTLNDGCIPHFRIPCGNRLSHLAKWIKLNDNWTTSRFADTDSPSSMLHIIDLYTQPDNQYNEEGEAKPDLPVPGWFHFLMVGPSVNFALLHSTLLIHNNWGLTCEVHHYCDLDHEFTNTCIKLEQLQVDLNAIQQACSTCKSRLQLVRAAEQVEKLKNIPCKPQATCGTWKRKSTRCGHPV